MFPVKRTDKLMGRERKDINSIIAIIGAIQSGVPLGKNNDKKCAPCLMKPVNVTKIKIAEAIAKVTMI
jgi:hypothetical protein